MSSLQQRGHVPQSSLEILGQRIGVGDLVMVVRDRSGRLLGQVGKVIGKSADFLAGNEKPWELDRILATDWLVDMAAGPTAHAREDGLVVTSTVAFREKCLMRLDVTELGMEDEFEMDVEVVA